MLKKTVKKLVVLFYRVFCHLVCVDGKLVVFDSDMGKNYSGSPRAIYEKLIQVDKEHRFRPVWVFTRAALGSGMEDKPDCRIVVYGSLRYYYLMSRAGIWVFDTRHEKYLVKKKKTFYIQTWHGTPLKKLGLDMDVFNMAGEHRDAADYKDDILHESAKWDLLLSSSRFTSETFRRCFGYKGEVLECGYPRNDCLFEEGAAGPRDRKVILYAPTWRDNRYAGDGWYGYEPVLDIALMEKALSDHYRLVVKLHYLVKKDMSLFPQECIRSGFLTVVGNETDIAQLYRQADLLITDYSSVMFDFANLHRPMYFFAYDLEEYREQLRGFYFDFEKEAPGPIVTTTGELIDAIREAKESVRVEDFVSEYNTFEDGHASERVAERILHTDEGSYNP